MEGQIKIINNFPIVLAGKFISSLLTYTLSIFIARLYGAHLMGLFFLGLTIFNIFSIFTKLGLDNGILRFISLYNSEEKYPYAKGAIIGCTKIVFILGIALGIFLYAFSDLIAIKIFGKNDLAIFLKVFSIILPFFSIWGLLIEALKALKATRYLVINQNILFPFGNLLTILIAFHLTGNGALSLSFAYGFSVLLCGLMAGIWFFIKAFPEIKEKKSYSEIKKILKFSYPLLFVAVISLFIYWVDTLMIGIMLTSKDVGIYTSASKTALFIAFFLVSMGNITPPFFAEYHHKGKIEELEKLSRISARWSFYISFPIATLFILLSKQIMSIFGPNFVSGFLVLVFLSLGQLVNAASGLVGQNLIMTGNQNNLAKITFLAALLNIILNLVFIPRWGVSGAGAATGLTIATMNIFLSFTVYKFLGIKAYVDQLPKLFFLILGPIVIFFILLRLTNPYFAGFFFFLSYLLFISIWGLGESDRKFLHLLMLKIK